MDNSRIAIVTGANSGMGKATSIALAKTGAVVVMFCRSRERGEEAVAQVRAASGSSSVELMHCDLASPVTLCPSPRRGIKMRPVPLKHSRTESSLLL